MTARGQSIFFAPGFVATRSSIFRSPFTFPFLEWRNDATERPDGARWRVSRCNGLERSKSQAFASFFLCFSTRTLSSAIGLLLGNENDYSTKLDYRLSFPKRNIRGCSVATTTTVNRPRSVARIDHGALRSRDARESVDLLRLEKIKFTGSIERNGRQRRDSIVSEGERFALVDPVLWKRTISRSSNGIRSDG